MLQETIARVRAEIEAADLSTAEQLDQFRIAYTGPPIDRASLLRYIVSFRNHNEFHEQCVERIFTDLTARCPPPPEGSHTSVPVPGLLRGAAAHTYQARTSKTVVCPLHGTRHCGCHQLRT